MSQKERVKDRLLKVGYVDNFWAIENRMLRLGAIIHDLRKDGIEVTGAFGRELGKDRSVWKNYYYTLVGRPSPHVPIKVRKQIDSLELEYKPQPKRVHNSYEYR